MTNDCICSNVPRIWRLAGVTRTVRLTVTKDGSPYDFTGLQTVLRIDRDNSDFHYEPQFTVEGDDNNIIVFTWAADKQPLGDYTIEVTVTDGSGNKDRVNWHGATGVRLVEYSNLVKGEDAAGVESDSELGLDGIFTMNGVGMDAYEEWLADGNEGSLHDYILWMQGPAREAAEVAEAQMAVIQSRADDDHTTAGSDHTRAAADHTTAESDHTRADEDHQFAFENRVLAYEDHLRAEDDHTTAAADHTTAQADRATAGSDHTRAEADHATAASDHSTAASDHTKAGQDSTRAGSDHDIAVADHAQAEADHTRAEGDHTTAAADHTTAAADHTTAASDHTTAAADHTQAVADHAVMAGYDTRLTNVETDVTQLGQKVNNIQHGTTVSHSSVAAYSAFSVDGSPLPQGTVIINKSSINILTAESQSGTTYTNRQDINAGERIVANSPKGIFRTLGTAGDVSLVYVLPIADSIIKSQNIVDGSITTEKIANAATTTEKVADGAITLAKLANASVNKDKPVGAVDFALKGAAQNAGYTIYASSLVAYTRISDANFYKIPAGTKVINHGVGLILATDSSLTNRYDISNGESWVANAEIGYIQVGATGGNVELEVVGKVAMDGSVTTAKLADGSVTTGKIANGSIVSNKLVDSAVTIDKLNGIIIKSTNLYNKDDSDCVEGKYIYSGDGSLQTNASYKASGWIPVTEGMKYIGYHTGQYAFYDDAKVFIQNSGGSNINSVVTAPENAAYLRFSIPYYSTNGWDNTAQINESDTLLIYEKYYSYKKVGGLMADAVSDDALNNNRLFDITASRLWNGGLKTSADSLSNGETISLSNYPKSLKQGDKLSFYAEVTSWGNGITIGKGETDYSAAYLDITATQIILKEYANGETVAATENHGLTIESFVKVIVDISATQWTVILQTLQGTFRAVMENSYNNGTPRVKSNGAELTDVIFAATNSFLKCPIWMFGDSYFGIATTNRELYWLKEWGYLNALVQGYAGQNSTIAIADLQKCLAISRPKYLVWCLGMNDNNNDFSIWLGYVNTIKEYCSLYSCELVFGTIPQCLDSSYKHKDDMSDWIRQTSGCRFIDVAKAVGSDADGHWYGYDETYNYQSSDNVHPTSYGAKAIAGQFLIDFPELMQY